jgi:hypothetical protein
VDVGKLIGTGFQKRSFLAALEKILVLESRRMYSPLAVLTKKISISQIHWDMNS